eukprot:CAMPEP_0184298348 /NCGR_PEP_ID=MMETSP1049-20130417/9184_1 /TAXON_ID=77928 /ORGANISM="Proteomonas sulcata, Strain CCMP704" /LENGTH=149 /DNA_ID=CAMNT_0026608463 /DNA_START=87 /DNA_END=536 /DNA_ORIENTATION=+
MTHKGLDSDHRVVYSRHFHHSSRPAQVEWEDEMFHAAAEDLAWLQEDEDQLLCRSSGCIIVFTKISDLYIFLAGSGLHDELILSELLTAIVAVLRALMPKGPTAGGVLDLYAKVCLGMDEMVVAGNVEQLDPQKVILLSSLRWDKVNLA